MRRFLPVLFISFLILSCTNPRQINAELKQADCLMLHHPDSSLMILQGIKKANLKSSSQRAYYSLLISQALDRNAIYITSDSLIVPAVNYYENHGNASQKLRTCYYMAVIANNAGDSDEAMEWLGDEDTRITAVDERKETSNNKVKLNFDARLSVVYNFDRWYVRVYGHYNQFSYGSDLVSGRVTDWTANASLGFRF